jgi:hypothetical protein
METRPGRLPAANVGERISSAALVRRRAGSSLCPDGRHRLRRLGFRPTQVHAKLSVGNIQPAVADTLPNGFQAVAGDPRLFDLREKRTNNAGFRRFRVCSQRANRLSESFRHHRWSPNPAEKPATTKINTDIHIYACQCNQILVGKPK